MHLQVIYKSGVIRNLRLNAAFFLSNPKDPSDTLSNRCNAIVKDFKDGEVFKIVCDKNGVEAFAFDNPANNPAEHVKVVVPKDITSEEYKAKRLLRNELRKIPFTRIENWTTGFFKNLLNGEVIHVNFKRLAA